MAQQPASGSGAGGFLHEVVAERRAWFMVLGIVLVVLGLVALAFPLLTTIAAKTFLGWLFLIGGVVQIFHAFSTHKWGAFFFNLLVGVLYIFTGAWLAFFPLAGIVTLTVLLAAMFIAQGILEVVMAFRVQALKGWTWVLVSGLIALAVGVLIFAQLPSSAAWAIGLLVGINMVSSGWAYFFLALGARRNS